MSTPAHVGRQLRRASAVLVIALASASLCGQTPLTTALEVRRLSADDALKGLEVRLRGTVTFVGVPGSVFLQDETAGTFFRTSNSSMPQPGDVVEVVGRTHLGHYLPGLGMSTCRILGKGEMPKAIEAGYDDLVSGYYHYQWVAIEGIVRTQGTLEDGRGVIKVALGNRCVEVRMETKEAPPQSWVDSRVRVEGLAAGSINSRRQLVQPFLRTLDWSSVRVRTPAPAEDDVPRVSASELLTFRSAMHGNHRIRIGGVVTALAANRTVFVRSETTAFAIRFVQSEPLKVGDRIDVLGFPQLERFSASVIDAKLVAREEGPPPPPRTMTVTQLIENSHDGELVALTAWVTDSFRSGTDYVLTLQGNSRAVQARIPVAESGVPVGSRVRVTGICQVESSVDSGYNARPESISLRVRSLDDIVVLQAPSWWTVRRLGLVLAMLASALLVGGLWIFLLRRQVVRQTSALRRRIESEAALQERNRIAREFHDTLEQELTGLGLRLDAAAKRAFDEKGQGLIRASRGLVSKIQVETRNLISDLRSPAESTGDLVTVLREVVEAHADRPGVSVVLQAQPLSTRLPAGVLHHLRMIASEGVTNALKHAKASRIEIRESAQDERLTLEVHDNGFGFDIEGKTQGQVGHFGCVGIRERCRKIGADVVWQSEPGRGTSLIVTLPLIPANEPPAPKDLIAPLVRQV